MNLGIEHGGRKAGSSLGGGGGGRKIPREVAAMAKQMGIDMSEMGAQAENMWNMLNDMSDTDPAAYEAFIKEQVEGAGEEDEARRNSQRTFTPEGCFVVKSKFSTSGAGGVKVVNAKGVEASGKLFVNICCHEGIQRPMNADGSLVGDDRPHLDNMQIPLVVGELRPATDSSGQGVAAVDVVFNPWCTKKVQESNIFRTQIVEL